MRHDVSIGALENAVLELYGAKINPTNYGSYGFDSPADVVQGGMLIAEGYAPETILELNAPGIKPSDYGKFGINSAADADAVKGISKNTIDALNNSGIKPSILASMSRYGHSTEM